MDHSTSGAVGHDQRQGPDRRQFSAMTLTRGAALARRRGVRRATDRCPLVLDWYPPGLLFVSLGILLLSCLDAVMTLNLLQLGAVEANPLMAALLEHDVSLFVNAKISLTAFSLIVLTALSHHRTAWFARIDRILALWLLGYVALTGYEFVLLLGLT